eukprot:gnl/TRDRNA2_/TRDRNA2_94341_c0_seq1.p1 gnl/TRDRNA2_/TRDRNA2_94341_c0~~gnl/TRDRNA2_/TRDRNA2_94341_c0_seq1.p1  ORF type:complete len:389 (-),score=40.50 gnl/TRDRNA2_/TRDRNA2_94341_c0_seq1:222-1253(-)
MGFGLPASLAMLSESSPKSSRIFVQSVIQSVWSIGYIGTLTFGFFDDASLQHMHWRIANVVVSIPGFVLLIASIVCLRESAVFLMSVGKQQEAREVLAEMRETNKAEADIGSVVPNEANAEDMLGSHEQLELLMRPRYIKPLIAASLTSFMLFLHLVGMMYVVCELGDDEHTWKKGTKMLLMQVISWPLYFVVPPITDRVSRQHALALTMILGCASSAIMARTGLLHDPPLVLNILYYFGFVLYRLEECLGCVVSFQYAAEMAPTRASATAVSIVAISGKFASVLAPILFEQTRLMFNAWSTYFVAISFGCLATVVLVVSIPMPAGGKEARRDASEATPLKLP